MDHVEVLVVIGLEVVLYLIAWAIFSGMNR